MSETPEIKPLIRESSTSESTNVKVVLEELEAGTVQIPDYQRDSDQWDATTKSLLVESVINNLSVPAFFFEVGLDKDGVERNQVIDGQQRLTTLGQFYRNTFRLVPSAEANYISPNSLHYAGKTFDELPAVYKAAFQKYRLTVIKLRDLENMRLEVFRRINQGGTPLSGQDIRLAYWGEHAPSLAFVRLAGIYDGHREASQRFILSAARNYGLSYPWENTPAQDAWKDLWEDKELARGQTASEMFLWSLMAAQYAELDAIIQNRDALAKLNVRFSQGIDEAMDVYCAQLNYQDRNPSQPTILFTIADLRAVVFPHFAEWIAHLGANGPSLDVRKHRTIASLIGGAYRANLNAATMSPEQWTKAVEFIRRPVETASQLGIEWPQSRRWDGAKGHRAQLEAASQIAARIAL